jgi:hypothetical protein
MYEIEFHCILLTSSLGTLVSDIFVAGCTVPCAVKVLLLFGVVAYADALNLLGGNTDTVKKNTETLIDASKEVGLEVNVKNTKYMLLSYQETQVKIGTQK